MGSTDQQFNGTETTSHVESDDPSPSLTHNRGLKAYCLNLWRQARKRRQIGLRERVEIQLQDIKPGETGGFSKLEQAMLLNILHFGQLRAEDVMVPRADIMAIDEHASMGDLLRLFQTAQHSRVPLFHESLDDPRGMVHIKDFLHWLTDQIDPPTTTTTKNGKAALRLVNEEGFDLSGVQLEMPIASAQIRREMIYAPPSMPVLDLFLRMQATHTHLALIVDEYGGTDGLVSIEDLVEEIVGEIEDEHDEDDRPLIRKHPHSGLLVDSRTPIEDLEVELGVDLLLSEDDDIDTLGGLIFTLAGRVPVKGQIISHPNGLDFEILDANPRRINEVRIMVQGDRLRDRKNAEPDAGPDAGPDTGPNANLEPRT